MFLRFLFLESIKNMGTYLSIFQSSAGGSQACVAELVQFSCHMILGRSPMRDLIGPFYLMRLWVVNGIGLCL